MVEQNKKRNRNKKKNKKGGNNDTTPAATPTNEAPPQPVPAQQPPKKVATNGPVPEPPKQEVLLKNLALEMDSRPYMASWAQIQDAERAFYTRKVRN